MLAGGCRERGGSFRYGSQKGLTWLSGFEGGPTLRHATTGAKMPATAIKSEGVPPSRAPFLGCGTQRAAGSQDAHYLPAAACQKNEKEAIPKQLER